VLLLESFGQVFGYWLSEKGTFSSCKFFCDSHAYAAFLVLSYMVAPGLPSLQFMTTGG
jgi:hypothetical protein